MDTLANALNSIKVAEQKGLPEARIVPASKLVKEILSAMQAEQYIGEFELEDNGKSGEFRIVLAGKINNCGAIKPRFSVRKEDWDRYEERYLPARNVGILLISTSKGVVTHKKAKELGIGGKLLAYIY